MGPENSQGKYDGTVISSDRIQAVIEEQKRLVEAKIAEAKEAQPDKEVFDLTTLRHYFPVEQPEGDPAQIEDALQRKYEEDYYLAFPEVTSIREYAEQRFERDKDNAS